MIDSGGMVGELVGGNISVLWAMAEERVGRRGITRSTSTATAADRSVRPTRTPTTFAATGKRRGEIGEAAFLAKVSALGFGVAKTWGYNFHAHGHTMVPYGADEIDALVAYCVPENTWYVFPVSFFAVRVSMNLFPASRRKRSRFEKYREAWWILRGEVGKAGTS